MANYNGVYNVGVVTLSNADHFTGNTTFTTGCTVNRAVGNPVLLVDGNYTINFSGNVVVNCNGSPNNLLQFEPNNKATSGTDRSWQYIDTNGLTSVNFKFSYVKVTGAQYGVVLRPSASAYLDKVFCIWNDCCRYGYYIGGTAAGSNWTISRLLCTRSTSAPITYTGTSVFSQIIEKLWYASGVPLAAILTTNAPNSLIIRKCVFPNAGPNIQVAGKNGFILNFVKNYVNVPSCTSAYYYFIYSAGGAVNMVMTLANNIINGAVLFLTTGAQTQNINCKFNDCDSDIVISDFQYDYALDLAATSKTTSDNDYFAGTNGADAKNVDVTSGMTTSTSTPPQYKNLVSNRTNPKTTPNMLYECDNITVSGITSDAATVTFDNKNSHAGTTVDADSASGQPVLNVTATSDFVIGEDVEIAKGTAREEYGEVLSINAGVSITLAANLTFSHSAANADVVAKNLRHAGYAFIKYGLSSGVYDMQTFIPPYNRFGEFYCGLVDVIDGHPVAFNYMGTGMSVSLTGLKGGTTIYFKVCSVTPNNKICESAEGSFTTAPAGGGCVYLEI